MAERFAIERVPLSAKDLEKAKNELRETPEVVKEALEKLRKLIQGKMRFLSQCLSVFLNL
jgi:flagellar biosynthesis chaperone FliJ